MLDNTSEEIPNSSSTSTSTLFSIVVSVSYLFTHDRNLSLGVRWHARLISGQNLPVPLCVYNWAQIWPGISQCMSGLVLRVTECNEEAWNPHCLTRPAKTPRPLMSDWLNETEPRPLVRKQHATNGSQHPEHINNKSITIIFTQWSSLLKG